MRASNRHSALTVGSSRRRSMTTCRTWKRTHLRNARLPRYSVRNSRALNGSPAPRSETQIVRASSLSAGLGLDAAEGAVTRQAETPSVSRAVIRLVPSGRVGSTQAPSPAATRGRRYLPRLGGRGTCPKPHSFGLEMLAAGLPARSGLPGRVEERDRQPHLVGGRPRPVVNLDPVAAGLQALDPHGLVGQAPGRAGAEVARPAAVRVPLLQVEVDVRRRGRRCT